MTALLSNQKLLPNATPRRLRNKHYETNERAIDNGDCGPVGNGQFVAPAPLYVVPKEQSNVDGKPKSHDDKHHRAVRHRPLARLRASEEVKVYTSLDLTQRDCK